MFWRTIASIFVALAISACAATQELVVSETTIQFEFAEPSTIALAEESPSTPEAQVERFLLVMMEVLADVDRPAEAADFDAVATEEFARSLTADFNEQKSLGYGYEDLDGIEIWFSPISYPVFFADDEDLPELSQNIEVQLVGCFIDNGVEFGRDPLTAEAETPTRTFVRASLIEDAPSWKLTAIEWSTSADLNSDWCKA